MPKPAIILRRFIVLFRLPIHLNPPLKTSTIENLSYFAVIIGLPIVFLSMVFTIVFGLFSLDDEKRDDACMFLGFIGRLITAKCDPAFWIEKSKIEFDAEKAINDLNNAVNIAPDNNKVFTARGEYYFKKGMSNPILDKSGLKIAIADFDKSLGFKENAPTYEMRGLSNAALDNNQNAISDLSEAVKLNISNADYWFNLGIIKEKTKDLEGAISDISKSVDINPKQTSYKIYELQILYENNKMSWEKYEESLQYIIKIDPKNAKVYYLLGEEYFSNKDFLKSEDYLKQAQDLDAALPDIEITIELANLLKTLPTKENDIIRFIHSDAFSKDFDITDKIIADNESNKKLSMAYNMRGMLFLLIGDFRNSFESFNNAIKFNDQSVENYADIAVVMVRKCIADKKYSDESLQFMEENANKALSIRPNYYTAYNIRGFVNLLRDNVSKAMDDANRSLEIRHNELGYLLRAFAEMDDIEDHQKRVIAIVDFTSAIKYATDMPVGIDINGSTFSNRVIKYSIGFDDPNTLAYLYYIRGEIYVKENENDLALSDFEKSALTENGTFADPHYRLGKIYENKNDFEKSLDEISKVLDEKRRFVFDIDP